MGKQINIFIVDDHQIVIDGIVALLSNVPDIKIAGVSTGSFTVVKEIIELTPDVVLMDISLGDHSGIELTKTILQQNSEIKIIMLSMYNTEEVIFSAIDAGAKGYLPKNTTKDEILKAIYAVSEGKKYFNQDIAATMLDSVIIQRKTTSDPAEKPCLECLTNREIQTLKLFAQGFSNQEIADKLFISVRTVESHKTHIMQKLGYKSMVEMIKFAIKQKLIEI